MTFTVSVDLRNLIRSRAASGAFVLALTAPLNDVVTRSSSGSGPLKAKSITYLGVPGVPQMLERIGMANAIKSKAIIPDDDIGSELVAKGEVELVIVVITQILTTPGVDLVGARVRIELTILDVRIEGGRRCKH